MSRPAPRVPTVPPPAAAQAVRTVDSTGALSEIRTTRASDDSPVEVTGPVDWSSASQPAVVPPSAPAPAAESGGKSASASSSSSAAAASAAEQPSRKSVLGRGGGPKWAPVTGEIGAIVPTPSDEAPPPVADAFEAVPAEPAESAPTEVPEKRRGFNWFSPLGYLLLALVGGGIGVGLYFFVLR